MNTIPKILHQLKEDADKLDEQMLMKIDARYLLKAIYYYVKFHDGFEAAIAHMEYLEDVRRDMERETL